jgi:hypothetical protein
VAFPPVGCLQLVDRLLLLSNVILGQRWKSKYAVDWAEHVHVLVGFKPVRVSRCLPFGRAVLRFPCSKSVFIPPVLRFTYLIINIMGR